MADLPKGKYDDISARAVATDHRLVDKLLWQVSRIELRKSVSDCLAENEIVHYGDLVTLSEKEMRKLGIQPKDIKEIKEFMDITGVHFGMHIPFWPDKNAPKSEKNEAIMALSYALAEHQKKETSDAGKSWADKQLEREQRGAPYIV